MTRLAEGEGEGRKAKPKWLTAGRIRPTLARVHAPARLHLTLLLGPGTRYWQEMEKEREREGQARRGGRGSPVDSSVDLLRDVRGKDGSSMMDDPVGQFCRVRR